MIISYYILIQFQKCQCSYMEGMEQIQLF